MLNLAIERGTLAASVRAFYELPVSYAEVPVINTVDAALLWAGRLANGEAQRIAAGGPALAWPAIAEVNAAATALQTAANAQSTAKDAFDLAQESVSDQRPTVDLVIKDLWDTIEFNLRAEEPSSLRRKAREWGVVYDGEDEEEEPPVPPRRRPHLERAEAESEKAESRKHKAEMGAASALGPLLLSPFRPGCARRLSRKVLRVHNGRKFFSTGRLRPF